METLKQNAKISTVLLSIAICTWLLSLALPAEEHVGYGIIFLLLGWGYILDLKFAWFANIFILIAFRFVKNDKYRSGLWFSTLALITSLQTLFMSSIMGSIDDNPRPPVWEIGYYVWELSFILMILFSLYLLWQQKKAPPTTPLPLISENGASI